MTLQEKHRAALLQISRLGLYGFIKGAVKLAINFKPLKYAVYGKISGTLLVVPSTCGSETSTGAYKTSYVRTDKDDGLFVCGPAGTCGKNEKDIKGISFSRKLFIVSNMIWGGIRAFIRVKGGFVDKMLLLLLWLEWAGSLQWLYACHLERALSEVVEKYGI